MKKLKIMEKYDGQSGIFKIEEYKNMLAYVGGDKNNKSEISIGILDITIDGKKEVGLHFVKCNKEGDVHDKIEDFEKTIDDNEPSFMFIPHSESAIDFLIECLEYLKSNLKTNKNDAQLF
jgi:hypothetical protein